jgi:riboflavin kinase / FMN adenylyltransferase
MATDPGGYDRIFPAECQAGALTLGNFDGVHLGHQALLALLRRQADALGGPAVAVTFDPPPSQLLRPETPSVPLTTLADRINLLRRHGADRVLVLNTTMALLRQSAREFFDGVILEGARPKAVVPGYNFAFGRGREGNVSVLSEFCRQAGIDCVPAQAFVADGEPVSSSRIRSDLLAGRVAHAARLLGRSHRVTGVVTTGQRRGRQIGFPTANLERVDVLVPGDGVYAVRVEHAGRSLPGAANVGPNPTFGEHARKLEVHLIDFEGELYGATLNVAFLDRLRDTRKFDGVDALSAQLRADIAAARRIADNSAL